MEMLDYIQAYKTLVKLLVSREYLDSIVPVFVNCFPDTTDISTSAEQLQFVIYIVFMCKK